MIRHSQLLSLQSVATMGKGGKTRPPHRKTDGHHQRRRRRQGGRGTSHCKFEKPATAILRTVRALIRNASEPSNSGARRRQSNNCRLAVKNVNDVPPLRCRAPPHGSPSEAAAAPPTNTPPPILEGPSLDLTRRGFHRRFRSPRRTGHGGGTFVLLL